MKASDDIERCASTAAYIRSRPMGSFPYACDRVGRGSLFRRTVLLPTVNFPYRWPRDRVLPDAVVTGPTALKVEIELHGILAEGGRRVRQAQRQSGN